MTLIDKTRRYVADTDLESIAHLAAEGIQRRQIAAAFEFKVRDGSPNKTLLKQAAEGLAGRVVGAQLPLVSTPEDVTAALQQLGVDAELVDLAVGRLLASRSIVPEQEQLAGQGACDSMIMYFNAAGTGLHVNVYPTLDGDAFAEMMRESGHALTQEAALAELRNPPESPVTGEPTVQS